MLVRMTRSFPAFTDYDVTCEGRASDGWFCRVTSRTDAAKRHYIGHTHVATEEEARRRLIERYNQGAPADKRVPLDNLTLARALLRGLPH